MKPARFRYHAPKTIEEALDTLAEVAPEDGRVLAGGQSLVPIMAFRLARPAHLVDINGIEALARLAVDGDRLCIGACVRHAAFHKPVEDGPLGRLLSAVVRHIAHYPIRTRGTFCGSLAHADPASEWFLVAATLGGEIAARSARGTRRIAAIDFFQGLMATTLEEDELLEQARLPVLAPELRWGFYEFSRRAGDYALAMALASGSAASRRRRGAFRKPKPCSPENRRRSASFARRRRLPPKRSIRSRISRRAPSTGATSSARLRVAPWSAPRHEPHGAARDL